MTLLLQITYSAREKRMAKAPNQRKAQAAWDRLMALGGHGVWDADIVIVSLADSAVTDDDLGVFRDFPFIQVLDLSRTAVRGPGLAHLDAATALEKLIAFGTKLSKPALESFREAHSGIKVVTKPSPKRAANPFTGEPL
jgi:hypothetical protein